MKNTVGTRACPSQAAGDACPVCLEKVFAGIDAVLPPCGHAIHEKCASAAASTGTLKDAALFTCPVCRNQCPHDQLTSAHANDPHPGSKVAERHASLYKYHKAARACARVRTIRNKHPSTQAETTACILEHRKKWRAISLIHAGPRPKSLGGLKKSLRNRADKMHSFSL